MIKKLLLFVLPLVALSSSAQTGEKTVLWTGNAELTWDGSTAPHVDAEKCADIIAGDKIVITVSSIDAAQDWPSCFLRSTAANTDLCNAGLWDYKSETLPIDVEMEIPYDRIIVDAFKEGFYAVGAGANITQISLLQTGDPSVVLPTGNVLWFDPRGVDLGNWANSIDIHQDHVQNLKAGQVIKISVKSLDPSVDWPQIAVQSEAWTDITTIPLWDDKTATFPLEKSFDVTEDNLPTLKEGFHIKGAGATLTLVTYEDKTPTGIVVATLENTDETVAVFNTQGMLVRRASSLAEALEGLPSGLYIANGKKIFK